MDTTLYRRQKDFHRGLSIVIDQGQRQPVPFDPVKRPERTTITAWPSKQAVTSVGHSVLQIEMGIDVDE
ncbi:MAG: hypothetical protein ACLPXB_02230 [Thiobacillaceae bacterium]